MSHETAAVPFFEVYHAVADENGNVHCAGAIPAPPPKSSDDPYSFYTTSAGRRLYCQDAIWSYDARLRAGAWRREGGAVGWLAVHAPGSLSVFPDGGDAPFVVSMNDGMLGDGPPPPLRAFRRVHRDVDGTFVVRTQNEDELAVVARVSPANGWRRVPLFDAKGVFARLFASNELSFEGESCCALASDGDLVVHVEERHVRRWLRFDRSGRRTLAAPSTLKGFPQEATLVAGRDGIVWGWAKGNLCALTRDAVTENVLRPGMGEGLGPALASLPDGTLFFFGDDGRVACARTKGTTITSFEVTSAPI